MTNAFHENRDQKKSQASMDLIHQLTRFTSGMFSILIFFTIIALLLYTGGKVLRMFTGIYDVNAPSIVHDIALVIVLVKAYRVLLFYFRKHHVSVKYIIEISIIAPSLEIIFAADQHDPWVNALFGAYSIASLIIYLHFYEKFEKIDTADRRMDAFLDEPTK